METLEKDIKVVRVGDSVMCFYGKERRVINKSDNVELFNSIIELIESNNKEKIKNILFNIESEINSSFNGKISIKDGKVLFGTIHLPEIASKKIISIYASGQRDFSPIEKFYEKLVMASKNIDKVNEILNTILSYNKSKIFFTESGNLIFQAMNNLNKNDFRKKTIVKNCQIYLFNEEEFGHETQGVFFLVNPMDILRISSESLYVYEGAIAASQYSLYNEPENNFELKMLYLRRARLLRKFNQPEGIFAKDEFEDLYDMNFEFMK